MKTKTLRHSQCKSGHVPAASRKIRALEVVRHYQQGLNQGYVSMVKIVDAQ